MTAFTVDLCNLAQQIKRCNKKQAHHLADIMRFRAFAGGAKGRWRQQNHKFTSHKISQHNVIVIRIGNKG